MKQKPKTKVVMKLEDLGMNGTVVKSEIQCYERLYNGDHF